MTKQIIGTDPNQIPLNQHLGKLAYLDAIEPEWDNKLDSEDGTATDLTLQGSITEEVYAITGATPALDPRNGTIQTWTLTGGSTPTDSLASGQSLLLEVNGAGFGITWPPIQWKTEEGNPPELASGVVVPIVLWKVGTTLRGARVGDA